jgi:AcrR family transcriptional regulator
VIVTAGERSDHRSGGRTGRRDALGTEDRPARFVDAARVLADRTGSAAFTVAQVVEEAGLSLKAFYRCFGGKDDLLVALLGADSAVGADLLAERMAAAAGPEARLQAFVRGIFELATLPGAQGYAAVLVREYRRLCETHADDLDVALAPLVGLLEAEIAVLGGRDPHRDARATFALLLAGLHDVVLGRAPAAEVSDHLWRFCWRGLGGGAPGT